MFSKIMVVLSVVLLPILGVSAHASSVAGTTVTISDDEGSGGTDCFYDVNRSRTECQIK